LVLVDNFSHFTDFLFLTFDLSIVLLNAIHKSLTSFWERQVHLVCLKLKIFLALGQVSLLITEMLSALFESILAKNTLGMCKPRVDVLKLLPRLTNFLKKAIVIVFVLFVVVSLLGVQVIQLSLVSKVDLLDLLFKA